MNAKPDRKGIFIFSQYGSEKYPGADHPSCRMPGFGISEIVTHSEDMLAGIPKITHLGTGRLKNHGYNPVTVFSAQNSLFSGFVPHFMRMHNTPAFPCQNTQNLPVIFSGGGFAGRAGFLSHGLWFFGF